MEEQDDSGHSHSAMFQLMGLINGKKDIYLVHKDDGSTYQLVSKAGESSFLIEAQVAKRQSSLLNTTFVLFISGMLFLLLWQAKRKV